MDYLEDDGIGGLQTVYYDELGTWSHYWGQWSGTGKFTGNEVTQFIHLNYGWNEDGKVNFFNANFDAGFFRDVNCCSKQLLVQNNLSVNKIL